MSQPLVFLPVAGTLFEVFHLALPNLVVDAADEVGRAAAGTGLFTLGLILSKTHFAVDREILFSVLAKNVIQPIVILVVGSACGLSGDLLKMAFVIGVLPSATEVPTLSIASGIYTEKAAATTMLSTLVSILSIGVGVAVTTKLP